MNRSGSSLCTNLGHGSHKKSGGGGPLGAAEKAVHVDLNGDGRIGGGKPAGHQKSGGGFLVKQAEKMTHMDLNGDGRIGGGSRAHH